MGKFTLGVGRHVSIFAVNQALNVIDKLPQQLTRTTQMAAELMAAV